MLGPMSTRRDVLVAGAAIASSLVAAGCTPASPEPGTGSVDVAKADVPVGGGIVLADAGFVLTQPEAGTFVAFSAKCTHQGCTVREVRPDGIYCACHGSLFDSTDGAPTAGPATQPLLLARVTDKGTTLTIEA